MKTRREDRLNELRNEFFTATRTRKDAILEEIKTLSTRTDGWDLKTFSAIAGKFPAVTVRYGEDLQVETYEYAEPGAPCEINGEAGTEEGGWYKLSRKLSPAGLPVFIHDGGRFFSIEDFTPMSEYVEV